MASQMPPPPLGARPEGLLALLGIQAGGRFPQHLTEELLPTAELLQWYLEQETQEVNATLALTGLGSIQTVATVPNDQQWILRDCSMWCASNIPGTITGASVAMQVLKPGTIISGILAVLPSMVGGRSYSTLQLLTPYRILFPGESVRLFGDFWAGTGTANIVGSLRYVPLQR